MNFAAEIARLKAEYDTLSEKIATLPGGPVRLALKKERNAVVARAVDIRGRWIDEETRSATPQHVPRLQFADEVVRNRAPEDSLSTGFDDPQSE